jgi:hypothetical protein
MRLLLQATAEQIQSGVYLGVNKAVVPFWEDGANIAFSEFGVKKIGGATLATTLDAAGIPWDMEQAFVNNVPRVFIGTGLGVYLAERIGSSWSDNSIYTWPSPSQYADLETWGTWILGTNNLDPVMVWKNTGTGAALAGTTFTRAKVLKRKSPFVFAMNTDFGEDSIHWCTDSNPEVWGPLSTNTAGQLTLRDIDSGIQASEDLQDYVAVYSRNNLYLGQYQGSGVWGFRRAVSGIGAVSRRSIVKVDPLNYGLNENGIFQTDGNSFAYLDDPAISKWLLGRIDWSKRSEIWGYHDSRLKRVTWYFPVLLVLGGGKASVHYHYEGGIFSRGSLDFAAADTQEVFEYPIVVDSAGKVGLWQAGEQNYGADVPWSVRTKPIDFGANNLEKTLELIQVEGVWESGLLRVWVMQHPEDPSPDLFHEAGLQRQNYMRNGGREGPYFRFEISGAKPAVINMIECHGNVAGLVGKKS